MKYILTIHDSLTEIDIKKTIDASSAEHAENMFYESEDWAPHKFVTDVEED